MANYVKQGNACTLSSGLSTWIINKRHYAALWTGCHVWKLPAIEMTASEFMKAFAKMQETVNSDCKLCSTSCPNLYSCIPKQISTRCAQWGKHLSATAWILLLRNVCQLKQQQQQQSCPFESSTFSSVLNDWRWGVDERPVRPAGGAVALLTACGCCCCCSRLMVFQACSSWAVASSLCCLTVASSRLTR